MDLLVIKDISQNEHFYLKVKYLKQLQLWMMTNTASCLVGREKNLKKLILEEVMLVKLEADTREVQSPAKE